MDNLSGGEKTVAALALLFAIHRYATNICYNILGNVNHFYLVVFTSIYTGQLLLFLPLKNIVLTLCTRSFYQLSARAFLRVGRD